MLEEKREPRESQGPLESKEAEIHEVHEILERNRNARGKRLVRRRRRLNPRFVILCAVAVIVIFMVAGLLFRLIIQGGSGNSMSEELPKYVEEELLSINQWSRPGDPLTAVKGVVIHYVGNPGTTAKANRNYFESLSAGRDGVYASSHFIVGLEGEVIQCIPLNEIAYASNTRNTDSISIEVCHPDDTGEFAEESYKRCVELTAWLCQKYDLKPEQDVIRHYDVTGKECPLYYVKNPEAWEKFLKDVSSAMR